MAMRTTVVINDDLSKRLKKLAMRRNLSEFVNQCIQEHFERQEKSQRIKELEEAYSRAAKNAEDLSAVDNEDWPEW